jgi:hypothetical protein
MLLEDESQPPTLHYAPQPVPFHQRVGEWFSTPGADTFVGSSALLFAILGLMTLTALPWEPVYTVLGWPLCVLASLFAIGALFERQTSKTFPLAALAMVVVYALVMSLAFH